MIIDNSKGGIHMKRMAAIFMLLCLLLTVLPLGAFATETTEAAVSAASCRCWATCCESCCAAAAC